MNTQLKLNQQHDNKKSFSMIFQYLLIPIYLFFLTFSSEAIGRLDGYQAWLFIIESPWAFCLNFLIITLFFIFFWIIFNRKYIILPLLSFLVLFVSIATKIKVDFRGTGLTPVDLFIINEAAEMTGALNKYFVDSIIFYSIVFLLASAVFILLIELPKLKSKGRLNLGLIGLVSFVFLYSFSPQWTMITTEPLKRKANATEIGGFFYFISQLNNPVDLKSPSEKTVKETFPFVFEDNQKSANKEKDETPDVIFIQSESFYDVGTLGLENFTEDPLPYYHQLIKNSDYFHVTSPVVGGGTANAEFEVMTGMPTFLFPTDMTVYVGYLNTPTISTGSILRSQGYDAQLIHPYWGGFYRRDNVYRYLGFNSFTSLENMKVQNSDFNEKAYVNPESKLYVSDTYLSEQIINTLKTNEDRKNFIFAITVQNHAPFLANPDYDIEYTGDIFQNTDASADFKQYINLLKDTDASLKKLIEYLKKSEKPTVVVFYADHQPPLFNFTTDPDKSESYASYDVTVFIWSNYKDLKNQSNELMDMTNLSEKVFETIGFEEPNYFKVLRNFREQEGIQTITKDYVIVNGITYDSESEIYKSIYKKYQIMAGDILGNHKYLEKSPDEWFFKDNKEYVPPLKEN